MKHAPSYATRFAKRMPTSLVLLVFVLCWVYYVSRGIATESREWWSDLLEVWSWR